MKTSKEKVRNERLKLDLSFHVVNPKFSINSAKKTISGSIMSFLSDKVIDCINSDGQLVASHNSGFTVIDADLSNIDKSISDHIDANINDIASK